MIPKVVLAAFAAAAIAVAVAVFAVSGGDSEDEAASTQDTLVSEVASAIGTPTAVVPSPAPTVPLATPIPQPTAAALGGRTACSEIQGTPYRSESERAFYQSNCVTQAPVTAANAPTVSINTAASCAADVQINTKRADKTFDVSGTSVETINASLRANGPLADGKPAAGLTQYGYGYNGSFCTRPGSCSLGAFSLSADITVTLPTLTTLATVTSDIKAIWDAFAERVRVHENRHVTIVEEGLSEIRRQLLALPGQGDCTGMKHEVDKVWQLGSSQLEQRQRAFHAADLSGQGGSVVR